MDNPFKNLFKSPETSVIGVDVGSSAVKIVQLRKKHGRAVLETYGEIALGPYAGVSVGQATNLPPEKIAEAITDLIREANVTTKNAGMSIPLRSSLVSLLELPKVDDKELKQMIPIEARKYIPVPISEVTMDWWVIPKEDNRYLDFVDNGSPQEKDKKEKVEVLVVSIHNEIIGHFNQIARDCELQTSFFEIEMFSTIRSLVDQNNAPVMIFDIGAAASKLYIAERGVIRASHIINKGGQDITISIAQAMSLPIERAEQLKRDFSSQEAAVQKNIKDIVSLTLDYIFSEAGSVILNYQKKYNKNIARVYITGGGATFPDVADVAAKTFQTEIVLGNPFDKTETPAFLSEVLKVTGMDFSVAVGLALRKLQEIS